MLKIVAGDERRMHHPILKMERWVVSGKEPNQCLVQVVLKSWCLQCLHLAAFFGSGKVAPKKALHVHLQLLAEIRPRSLLR